MLFQDGKLGILRNNDEIDYLQNIKDAKTLDASIYSHPSGQDQVAGQVPDQPAGQVLDQLAGQVPDQPPGQVLDQLAGQVPDQPAGQIQDQLAGKIPETTNDSNLNINCSSLLEIGKIEWISKCSGSEDSILCVTETKIVWKVSFKALIIFIIISFTLLEKYLFIFTKQA